MGVFWGGLAVKGAEWEKGEAKGSVGKGELWLLWFVCGGKAARR